MPSTARLQADVVVFDLKGLSTYPDLQAAMILIITDFILGRIEIAGWGHQGRRKQILMDECWELLKSQAAKPFHGILRADLAERPGPASRSSPKG